MLIASIFGVFPLSLSISPSLLSNSSQHLSLSHSPGALFQGANMASQDKGRPLPKFGEWDVNNPASAEGFTVIFQKARDEKKPATQGPAKQTIGGNNNGPGVKRDDSYDYSPKPKWFCCG